MLGGQTVSPQSPGPRRTSTISGADVLDPRGSRKTLCRKCFFRFSHRVSSSGGAPEGVTTLLHFCMCSRPLIQSVKSTFLTLRVTTPSGAPRQAPLDLRPLMKCLRRGTPCNPVKGSLLQNGFCTSVSDFEAKSCSLKNSLKNAPKNAPKNGMFSPRK